MKTLKNILLVLSTGYVFVYFSEFLFCARVRSDDSFGNWISTWIAYSFLGFVFLHQVSCFRIKSIWPLFLAGAAFGWLTEGVIAHTAYDSLPLSISFTGLAWHAIITVWVGWFAIRKSFFSSSPFATLKLAAAIGLCHGFWSIFWWIDPDGGISSVLAFATFSMVIATLFIFACWLANWSSSETFVPNRWVIILIYSMFGLYFFFITVPAMPLAVVILPVLLGLVYLGLRQNRISDPEGSFLDILHGSISLWKYLSLLALPATSILVYALAMFLNLKWHTNIILYIITTPLGFTLFGISLYKTMRTKPNL